MSDRELLELAAKAAGIDLTWDVPPKSPPWRMTGLGDDRGPASPWDPLTDDGDALRLAVKMEIGALISSNFVYVKKYYDEKPILRIPLGSDHYAATRRAIVRAATEIGKTS